MDIYYILYTTIIDYILHKYVADFNYDTLENIYENIYIFSY